MIYGIFVGIFFTVAVLSLLGLCCTDWEKREKKEGIRVAKAKRLHYTLIFLLNLTYTILWAVGGVIS